MHHDMQKNTHFIENLGGNIARSVIIGLVHIQWLTTRNQTIITERNKTQTMSMILEMYLFPSQITYISFWVKSTDSIS